MMKNQLLLNFSIILGYCLSTTIPVLANEKIDFESTEPANKTIKEDDIRLDVNYSPELDSEDWQGTIKYTIFYKNNEKITKELPSVGGRAMLYNLDGSGQPEVIITNFSAGTHCCFFNRVYHWDDNQFLLTRIGPLDGGRGAFSDIDGDGKIEFKTEDDSFLYAFTAYASSSQPILIFEFENGRFNHVTQEYPEIIRAEAWRLYKIIVERKNEAAINSALATYVAYKILLGEFNEGWEFMLEHYNKDGDWLDDQDFPTALKDLLKANGYLNKEGEPEIDISIPTFEPAEEEALM